jgi:hypothetical protein
MMALKDDVDAFLLSLKSIQISNQLDLSRFGNHPCVESCLQVEVMVQRDEDWVLAGVQRGLWFQRVKIQFTSKVNFTSKKRQ